MLSQSLLLRAAGCGQAAPRHYPSHPSARVTRHPPALDFGSPIEPAMQDQKNSKHCLSVELGETRDSVGSEEAN